MVNTQAHQKDQLGQIRQFWPYILMAFLISWSIEIPLALSAQGILSPDLPFSIHYLAAFGPLVAGIIMTWRENGLTGLKELLARITKWRVEFLWWIVALSPLIIFSLISVVKSIAQGTQLNFEILNHFDFLPNIGIAVILIWLATYGFGEEIGWRGYLLPRLQRNRSALTSALILGTIWAIWHIPSFFYLHTVSNLGTLIGFLIGVLTGSIFLTWLYNSSSGSVLIVAVWHGLFDYVTACIECKTGIIAAIISTLIMIWAVLVIILFKGSNLSHKEKHIL